MDCNIFKKSLLVRNILNCVVSHFMAMSIIFSSTFLVVDLIFRTPCGLFASINFCNGLFSGHLPMFSHCLALIPDILWLSFFGRAAVLADSGGCAQFLHLSVYCYCLHTTHSCLHRPHLHSTQSHLPVLCDLPT